MARLIFGVVASLSFSFKGLASELDQRCQKLVDLYPKESTYQLSRKLYQKAFIHSMNREWQEAEDASICSLKLLNGTERWSVEFSDLFGS